MTLEAVSIEMQSCIAALLHSSEMGHWLGDLLCGAPAFGVDLRPAVAAGTTPVLSALFLDFMSAVTFLSPLVTPSPCKCVAYLQLSLVLPLGVALEEMIHSSWTYKCRSIEVAVQGLLLTLLLMADRTALKPGPEGFWELPPLSLFMDPAAGGGGGGGGPPAAFGVLAGVLAGTAAAGPAPPVHEHSP